MLALLTLVVAVVVPHPAAVGLAFFLLGAAIHCQMDRFGAASSYVRGREPPIRQCTITSAGAGGDPNGGSNTTARSPIWHSSLPLLVVLEGLFRLIVAGALFIGTVYVLFRRRVATLAPVVFGFVPDRLAAYVPERYRS